MLILDLFLLLMYCERRFESVSIAGLSLPYCTVLRFKATLIFSFQVVELRDGCQNFGCQEAIFFFELLILDFSRY